MSDENRMADQGTPLVDPRNLNKGPHRDPRPSESGERVFYVLFVVFLIALAVILTASARETWNWFQEFAKTLPL